MKRILFVVLALALLAGCDTTTNETTVGANTDTQINGVTFRVDTTYVVTEPASMVARGRVTNGGTTTIATGWYVEAQFYTDGARKTKLGGNNTRISVPLSPGQETFWTISFSSSNVDVRVYPGFTVGDLRAIYKQ